jgi:hypothetical protein
MRRKAEKTGYQGKQNMLQRLLQDQLQDERFESWVTITKKFF